jgi:nucleotide-binding universal stress UspA family protein
VSIRTLLVPVDFSAHSRAALDLALQLAPFAQIHLIHSYWMQMSVGVADPFVIPTEFVQRMREAAQEQLEQLARPLLQSGIRCEIHLCEKPPATSIVDTARAIEADLIVMGAQGSAALKHGGLGSIADRVLRLAPCPVLTVKEPGSYAGSRRTEPASLRSEPSL